VTSAWPEILRAVEPRSRRLHAGLSRATPVSVSGDVVVVTLPPSDSVARSVLRDREAGEAFRLASLATLGAALRIPATPSRAEPAPSEPARAASPRASEGGAASPRADAPPPGGLDAVRAHPDVRAVIDAFGARVLSVRAAEPETGDTAAGGERGGAAS
jgi:hypothetical protein